jgi:hypothetical protein
MVIEQDFPARTIIFPLTVWLSAVGKDGTSQVLVFVWAWTHIVEKTTNIATKQNRTRSAFLDL